MRPFDIIDHLIEDILGVAYQLEDWARQLTTGRSSPVNEDVWDFY